MKKRSKLIPVLTVLLLAFSVFSSAFGAKNVVVESAPAADKAVVSTTIKLQIGSPVMNINGQEKSIDENGTVPVIQNGRTLLPVRALVEAMGGGVQWDEASKTVTLTRNNDVIRLTIGRTTAYLNNNPQTLDVAPVIINSRTMLPIRFIAERFGFDVGWNDSDSTVIIKGSGLSKADSSSSNNSQVNVAPDGAPKVFMTTDISPEGLMAIYKALGREATGKVAVKLSTGEPGGHNFLSPDLIKGLVKSVNGTIVECNTAYGGLRASTATHLQAAKDHGFTAIADVDIMDADGSISLPIENGTHLKEDLVGSHYQNYDFFIVLSHFKGHAMGGFGGAIKNISIGIASSSGKSLIHSAGKQTTGFAMDTPQNDFLESMAEAAKAVAGNKGKNILYINVMNKLSVDCDCDSSPAEPTMADIGILASLDPVALDKACVDLVYAAPDGKDLIERIESRNGTHTLEHAEKIGLGSQKYNLVKIDD